jgi:formylglycine-generating enzyme required for sulfatase activity
MSEYTDGLVSYLSSREISPKPLGLYDMGLSGSEWTNDWYASDYYSHSPVNDPQGPVKGT